MNRLLGGIAAIIVVLLWIIFGLTLGAAILTVSLTVIYFFIAAASLVPPQDFVPFIPFV